MDIKKLLTQIDNISEGSMKSAEKKPTGPKFVGKWKGTDPASKAKSKLVGENLLKDLEKEVQRNPRLGLKKELAENYRQFKEAGEVVNVQDIVKLDVPLLIRLLEYAREDANSDMDLHDVAEKLITLSGSGDVLSMDNYNDIVGGQEQIEEYGSTPPAGAASQAPQGTTDQTSPAALQQKADQDQIQKNTNVISQTLNQQGAAQPLNKAKFQGVMNKLDAQPNASLSASDAQQLTQIGVAASKALQNPQTAGQLKQLITKADQIDKTKQAQVKKAEQQVGTNEPADQQTQTPAGQPK